MECSEVQKRLSAYLEGSLPLEEKASVEEHLKPCQKCSQSLAELKRTLEHLQGLPEMGPPPWLAQKVMARVRSEAQARRGIWQILFYPIQVKVPLQAVAVIAIAVTTIYLFKAMQPAMHLSKEPLEEIRPPAISEVTKPPIPPESKAPSKISGFPRVPAAAPKVKREEPISESRGAKDTYDEALTAHRQIEDKTGPPGADLKVSKAEPDKAPVPFAAPPEEFLRAKAPPPPAETKVGARTREESELRAKGVLAERAAKKEAGFHLTLAVKDLEAATIQIEKAIADLGGKILRQEPQESKTILVAELSSDQLDALFSKLKSMGEVKGKAADFAAKGAETAIVRVEIFRIQ